MPTFFSNQQWDVTDYGIETRQGSPIYEIAKSRLTETRDGIRGREYNWPPHMAEKEWVNIEAFIEAFTQALILHAGAYTPKADLECLKASADGARVKRRQMLRLAEMSTGQSGFIDFASAGLPEGFLKTDKNDRKIERSNDTDAALEAGLDEK